MSPHPYGNAYLDGGKHNDGLPIIIAQTLRTSCLFQEILDKLINYHEIPPSEKRSML